MEAWTNPYDGAHLVVPLPDDDVVAVAEQAAECIAALPEEERTLQDELVEAVGVALTDSGSVAASGWVGRLRRHTTVFDGAEPLLCARVPRTLAHNVIDDARTLLIAKLLRLTQIATERLDGLARQAYVGGGVDVRRVVAARGPAALRWVRC